MRLLVAAVLSCVLATGCDHRDGGSYVLVVDDAALAPFDHDGQPWCPADAAPLVSVTVRLGAGATTTPAVAGPQPVWNASTLVADASEWARGVFLDVQGQCDGATPFRIGALVVHPDASTIERGGMALRDVGGLRALRLHLARLSGAGAFAAAPADWYPYDVAVSGYTSDGWPIYDDGSSAWDDGSGDGSGDSGDGSGDSGDGSGDSGDGSGDSGGDSGDSGGDSGGDSRLHHPPAPRSRVRSAASKRTAARRHSESGTR